MFVTCTHPFIVVVAAVVGRPFVSHSARCYGIIQLKNDSEVEAAIADMDGANFTSEHDEWPWALKCEKLSQRLIYCSNLPSDFSSSKTKTIFSKYSTSTSSQRSQLIYWAGVNMFLLLGLGALPGFSVSFLSCTRAETLSSYGNTLSLSFAD